MSYFSKDSSKFIPDGISSILYSLSHIKEVVNSMEKPALLLNKHTPPPQAGRGGGGGDQYVTLLMATSEASIGPGGRASHNKHVSLYSNLAK